MRKSYGHREESVIWHKCKCGLPTIVGSVAWELLQPARIRRGAWHHQSGGRGKMGRVWVVVSTLPPTRTDVGVWNLETKNVVNRRWRLVSQHQICQLIKAIDRQYRCLSIGLMYASLCAIGSDLAHVQMCRF